MLAKKEEVGTEILFKPRHILAITFTAALLTLTRFFNEVETLYRLAELTGAALLTFAVLTTIRRIHRQKRQVNVVSESLSTYRSRLETATSAEQRQRILDLMAQNDLLRNANLSHLDLSETQLPQVDLSGSDFTASKFNLVEMSDGDLRQSTLNYTNLRYSTMFRANLRKAQLQGATMNSADLREANLQSANLRAASLDDADLGDADLRGANLSHASLVNANLVNVRLAGANLSNCILPDGTRWQPSTDLLKYTHPTYVAVYNDDALTAPTWIRNILDRQPK